MNPLELTIEKILLTLHWPFQCQFPFKNFILDFADPINKIAIEVQGTYWHGHILKKNSKKANKIKDNTKRTTLEKHGWHVIYLWEHTIKRNPEKISQYLNREILKRIEI